MVTGVNFRQWCSLMQSADSYPVFVRRGVIFAVNPTMMGCWNIPNIQGLMNIKVKSSRCANVRHHANITRWRRQQSLKRTYLKRPDLLEKLDPGKEVRAVLENAGKE